MQTRPKFNAVCIVVDKSRHLRVSSFVAGLRVSGRGYFFNAVLLTCTERMHDRFRFCAAINITMA
jgi:hypothetical protein